MLSVTYIKDYISGILSERWPDDLDRSEAAFSSVKRFELLSLSSLTDWINVSNRVAEGATIAFILLSTSLSTTSPISENYLVGVLFSSDMLTLSLMRKKWRLNWFLSKIRAIRFLCKARVCIYRVEFMKTKNDVSVQRSSTVISMNGDCVLSRVWFSN